MNLHGIIEKVGALGVELEHDIATEARRAWTLLREELEKLREYAHPHTGTISVAPDGSVILPTLAGSAPVPAPSAAPVSEDPPPATSGPAPAADASPGPSPGSSEGSEADLFDHKSKE